MIPLLRIKYIMWSHIFHLFSHRQTEIKMCLSHLHLYRFIYLICKYFKMQRGSLERRKETSMGRHRLMWTQFIDVYVWWDHNESYHLEANLKYWKWKLSFFWKLFSVMCLCVGGSMCTCVQEPLEASSAPDTFLSWSDRQL